MKDGESGDVGGLADDIHGQGHKTLLLYWHCLDGCPTLRLTLAAGPGSPGIFFSFAEAVVHHHVTCCTLLERPAVNLQDMRRPVEQDSGRRDSRGCDCAGGTKLRLGAGAR